MARPSEIFNSEDIKIIKQLLKEYYNTNSVTNKQIFQRYCENCEANLDLTDCSFPLQYAAIIYDVTKLKESSFPPKIRSSNPEDLNSIEKDEQISLQKVKNIRRKIEKYYDNGRLKGLSSIKNH